MTALILLIFHLLIFEADCSSWYVKILSPKADEKSLDAGQETLLPVPRVFTIDPDQDLGKSFFTFDFPDSEPGKPGNEFESTAEMEFRLPKFVTIPERGESSSLPSDPTIMNINFEGSGDFEPLKKSPFEDEINSDILPQPQIFSPGMSEDPDNDENPSLPGDPTTTHMKFNETSGLEPQALYEDKINSVVLPKPQIFSPSDNPLKIPRLNIETSGFRMIPEIKSSGFRLIPNPDSKPVAYGYPEIMSPKKARSAMTFGSEKTKRPPNMQNDAGRSESEEIQDFFAFISNMEKNEKADAVTDASSDPTVTNIAYKKLRRQKTSVDDDESLEDRKNSNNKRQTTEESGPTSDPGPEDLHIPPVVLNYKRKGPNLYPLPSQKSDKTPKNHDKASKKTGNPLSLPLPHIQIASSGFSMTNDSKPTPTTSKPPYQPPYNPQCTTIEPYLHADLTDTTSVLCAAVYYCPVDGDWMRMQCDKGDMFSIKVQKCQGILECMGFG